jgi:hypothetical protein
MSLRTLLLIWSRRRRPPAPRPDSAARSRFHPPSSAPRAPGRAPELDEERKRCADSTALSPRRGKRTSGSRRPAPLWTNRKRARRTRMSGRDLRSFCVVARRVRGQSELGLNRLEIIARHRISGRFWLFRRRVEKSVCSRRRFGAKLTTHYADLQGFLRERRDSNPRPPA